MPRKWSPDDLFEIVKDSTSYRQVLSKLGLRPTGGNYVQVKRHITQLSISTAHFKGHAWNKGVKGISIHRRTLEEILKQNTQFQSYKLKKRLVHAGIKEEKCELCGWCERSIDGRIPLELDHINGDRYDNRIENLRILCPNCHSLQPTHRGKNIRAIRADAGTGRQS